MALYAIGDLHLSFAVHKPMDVFGSEWKNHVARLEKNWKKCVSKDDTVVVTGDHSWGRNMEECREDLEFIAGLPGRKILLRGNHDMFWDAKKTVPLNEQYAGRLSFCRTITFPTGMWPLWEQRATATRGRIRLSTLKSWSQRAFAAADVL